MQVGGRGVREEAAISGEGERIARREGSSSSEVYLKRSQTTSLEGRALVRTQEMGLCCAHDVLPPRGISIFCACFCDIISFLKCSEVKRGKVVLK